MPRRLLGGMAGTAFLCASRRRTAGRLAGSAGASHLSFLFEFALFVPFSWLVRFDQVKRVHVRTPALFNAIASIGWHLEYSYNLGGKNLTTASRLFLYKSVNEFCRAASWIFLILLPSAAGLRSNNQLRL